MSYRRESFELFAVGGQFLVGGQYLYLENGFVGFFLLGSRGFLLGLGLLLGGRGNRFAFCPIREQVLHVDFYRVVDGKPVAIALPVRLTGNAEGVKVGGKLALSARKLVVSGLMENLPDELVVDVTPLKVGQTIFVGDLQFEGLQFLSPATQAVCAVRVTRASRAGANQQ